MEVSSQFTPQQLYPRGRDRGIKWIGGSAGSKDGLDAVAKRKDPAPCRE